MGPSDDYTKQFIKWAIVALTMIAFIAIVKTIGNIRSLSFSQEEVGLVNQD